MADRDSNGVDVLDRFLAYKSRFMQFSVTEDVFHQVVEHIKELRKERDEARRIAAYQYAKHSNYGDESFAMRNFFQFHKWEHLKEDGK